MYKINKTLPNKYSEIGQANPLRWEILLRTSPDAFESQSGLIKCKDFFNELVRKYNTGQDSSIYSFDTKTITLNEEGVYFRMHYTTSKFISNLSAVIGDLTVELLDDGTVLLLVPRHYWASTYLTSLVTYYIRCCNCDVDLTSVDDLWEKTSDVAINNQGKALALKWGFKIPEEYSKYWYYCGKISNSVDDPSPYSASIVHNNGVMSWSNSGVQ
jgi:hypothetical protein